MSISKPVKIGLVVAMAFGGAAFLVGPKPDKPPATSADVVAATDAETIEVLDPIHDRPFKVSVWSPAVEDRHRLIIISHGFAGDRSSHNDLAAGLAALGYTVAAPTHPDLAGLESNEFSLDPLMLRPRHLSLTIDSLVMAAEQQFEQISIVGHSLGGYSALRVAGVLPSGIGVEAHCRASPGDDVLCSSGARSRLASLLVGIDPGYPDTRVDNLVLMAPGYGPLFSAESLESVDSRILLIEAENDVELSGGQVQELSARLPESAKAASVVGGHFVFLRSCTADELDSLPDLCIDDIGVDRTAVHKELILTIDSFLSP